MSELVHLSDQMAYAQAIVAQPERAGQSLLPAAYRGNPANVLIAMGLGQALGLTPAQALYEIYVVNGRPSPSANLMAGLVRQAGHKLRIKGDAQTCTATLIRSDDPDEPFVATWTIEQARAASLTGKDTWKNFPSAMLRARAISEVCRMGASECLLGMEYSAEEMRDVEVKAEPVRRTGLDALRTAVTPNAGDLRVPDGSEPVATNEDEPVDAEEVTDEPAPKLTGRQRGRLFALFAQKGIAETDQLAGIAHVIGRPVEHRDALTEAEFDAVVAQLETLPDAPAEAS